MDFDSTKSNLCLTFRWTLSLGIIFEGGTKASPFKLASFHLQDNLFDVFLKANKGRCG